MNKIYKNIFVFAICFVSIMGTAMTVTIEDSKNNQKEIKVFSKDNLTYEEQNRCTAPGLEKIGDITKNRYIIINGVANPLYCTFTDKEQALKNIKEEVANLLEILAKKYNLETLNDANWRKYEDALFEYLNVSTEGFESNEEFIKLRAFFDIYEGYELNDKILDYIKKEANLDSTRKYATVNYHHAFNLGIILPYFSPLAQEVNEIALSQTRQSVGMNVDAAANYAATWATGRNKPTYYSFSSDCANFTSQILEASGVSQVVYTSVHSGWWHKRTLLGGAIWTHSHSNSWTVADTFSRYMGVGYSTKNHYNFSANIRRGDFIAADWTSNGSWDHVGFVGNRNSTTITVNGQTYYNYIVAQHSKDYINFSSNTDWPTNDGRTWARVRR